ncbi:MAG TPA: glycosyltransferase family 4 protein [Chitinophagaceae bacterium]|nr:glycosyltransferase family 4 protein [Chitinophagaceae bacterium]
MAEELSSGDKKNKKVLFVLPSLLPGGAEHQTINQINYLVEKGYKNIRLAILSNRLFLFDKIKLSRENILLVEDNDEVNISGGMMKVLPGISRRLARYAKKENITDIIAILPMAHLACRLAKLNYFFSFKKQPALNVYYRSVTYEISPMDTFFKKAFNKFNSLLARFFDNRSLFISKAVDEDIRGNFYVPASLVLPNSLPELDISGEEGKTFLASRGLWKEGRYLILVPGRLQLKKGHSFFISSFKLFVEQRSISPDQVKVIFAGEGPLREVVEAEIASSGMQDYIDVCGFVENKILLSLYKSVDLIIIPSLHEGFGNVAIEGLMQKSLLLVSDTGGLSEIIRDGENGFKFQTNDRASFLDKLSYIYDNRHTELIDREALHREFLSKYTLESQMKKIQEFCGF